MRVKPYSKLGTKRDDSKLKCMGSTGVQAKNIIMFDVCSTGGGVPKRRGATTLKGAGIGMLSGKFSFVLYCFSKVWCTVPCFLFLVHTS